MKGLNYKRNQRKKVNKLAKAVQTDQETKTKLRCHHDGIKGSKKDESLGEK